jgi:hypothetical protein
MTTTDEYPVTYSVLADGRHEAFGKAAKMLRKNVRTVGEAQAEQGVPGWWDVTFRVVEVIGADDPVWPGDLPESADPVTAAKGEHARWGL